VPASLTDDTMKYEANLILVRPDHFVAWTSDTIPRDAHEIMAKSTGKSDRI